MNNNLREGGKYAFFGGLCGAAGSLFGKLSGGLPNYEDVWILNATFFVLMFLCNSAVWIFFAKALHALDSTLRATLLTTTINFLLSALIGVVVFHEGNKFLWVCGIILLIIGLVILQDTKLKPKSD